MVTWSQYFTSFVKLMWEDKTEFNPGVLTSYGYPLYYPSGSASIWTIKVAETQFLHLLFSNISLTKYQVKKQLTIPSQLGLDARNPVSRGLRTTQAQTSLRIRAVSMISAFVIRFLERFICNLATGEIYIF